MILILRKYAMRGPEASRYVVVIHLHVRCDNLLIHVDMKVSFSE